jgi:hypothetical protein
MNYVLYIFGTVTIVAGLIGLDSVLFHWLGIHIGEGDTFVVGCVSGGLLLWGIAACGLGSVIGLLKRMI